MELHKHHIIPKYMGGTNDPSNLIVLTRIEHANTHYNLWLQNGNKEDLCAYYILQHDMENWRKLYASLGGKTIAKLYPNQFSEMGRIAHTHEKRKIIGKMGADVCKEKGVNAFFDSKLRTAVASMGGKIQGKNNIKNGHLIRISKLPRIKGDRHWITNGVESKQIHNGEEMPDGFRFGRIQSKKDK